MRRVEVLRDEKWIEVHMSRLHKCEFFRMFEPDGEPVIGEDGKSIFYSTSEPYWSETYETWTIDIGQLLH